MLRNLSFRYKVPLSFSLAILLTGMVVAALLGWRTFVDLRNDLFRNAVELGALLSRSLTTALRHDDVWSAYQTLRGIDLSATAESGRVLIVLDGRHRVYVSNRPADLPVLSELHAASPELARLEAEVRRGAGREPRAYDAPDNALIYVIMPLLDDKVALGHLIIGYPRSLFLPRFYGVIKQVGLSTLAVMAVLLPVGWVLGKRMMTPLVALADSLGKVERAPLDQIRCPPAAGRDEIGRLSDGFRRMLRGLREQERLKREMIAAERLAAVGRVAAGVAHEINNPLGGMLNAIGTHRRHGRADALTDKTLDLLERGLRQIQGTVSALLVQARPESRVLTAEDVEDVRTLLQPDAQKKAVRLNWSNGVDGVLPLPAAQIRQIMFNLSLNAVQAAPPGSTVDYRIRSDSERLLIEVENDGVRITPEMRERIFEPFVHDNPAGHGLGLWVTYQIVRQLQGEIRVDSGAGHTRFEVTLPLERVA